MRSDFTPAPVWERLPQWHSVRRLTTQSTFGFQALGARACWSSLAPSPPRLAVASSVLKFFARAARTSLHEPGSRLVARTRGLHDVPILPLVRLRTHARPRPSPEVRLLRLHATSAAFRLTREIWACRYEHPSTRKIDAAGVSTHVCQLRKTNERFVPARDASSALFVLPDASPAGLADWFSPAKLPPPPPPAHPRC